MKFDRCLSLAIDSIHAEIDTAKQMPHNDIDNLVSMCAACHLKAEWEIRRSKNGKC